MMSKFKFRALSAVFIACFTLLSCTEKPGDNDKKPPKETEISNAFKHCDELHPIRSVVYTETEIEGHIVFYFSPTRNIKDVEGMKQADDFMKIVATNTTWENKFTAEMFNEEGSCVSFGDFVVEKNNFHNLKTGKFDLELLTHKYLTLDMTFETPEGDVLESKFYGPCSLFPEDKTLDWDYVMTSNVEAAQLLIDESDNTAQYHLAMSTVPYDVDQAGNILMKDAGFVFIGRIISEATADGDKVFPTGTFKCSNYKTAGTYDASNTGVLYYKEAGDQNPKPTLLTNDITISKKEVEDGFTVYTVEASFVDGEGITRKLGYAGPITILSGVAQLPVLDHDVTDFKGYSAQGVYYGNMLNTNSGLIVINILDETYDKAVEGEVSNGYAASLGVFGQMFNGDKAPELTPGKYVVQRSPMGEEGTALVGMPLSMMGMVLPFGTYMNQDTGGMGHFGWADQGYIEIKEASIKGTFEITFDFITDKGKHMAGKYNGTVDIKDESDDQIKDDGTSTLNGDYEMVLQHIPVARLYPRGELEVIEDAERCSYQRIDIGSRSGWDTEAVLKENGDIFSAGLITRLNEDGKLAPGRYKIVVENWPYYHKPGWAMKGGWSEVNLGDFDFTSWMSFKTGEGYDKYLYLDGHALIKEGEIIVERNDKDEEGVFTIKLDGYCVRKYNVTGTWKGKIINAVTGDPVKAAKPFEQTEEVKVRRFNYYTPEMMEDAGAAYREQLPLRGYFFGTNN